MAGLQDVSRENKLVAVVTGVVPKLIPFIQATTLYLVLYRGTAPSSKFDCVIKCLPILCLALFVILHGMKLTNPYTYSRRILAGLLFCCIGDACLAFNGYFELGMIFFAIGHLWYCLAFGFRPVSLPAGAVFTGLGVVLYLYIFNNVAQPLSTLGLVYMAIICIMMWRALVRVRLPRLPGDLRSWMKVCACVGAILFCLSDLVLGINKFQHPVPFANSVVMSTYYAGQFAIALSVVGSQKELPEDALEAGETDLKEENHLKCEKAE